MSRDCVLMNSRFNPPALSAEDCRKRRIELGLTPAMLAMRAGLAERTVLRFEAAEVASRFGTVLALRRALGFSDQQNA